MIADWIVNRAGGGFQPSLRLGYERVGRFDFTEVKRSNLLASATLTCRWSSAEALRWNGSPTFSSIFKVEICTLESLSFKALSPQAM